MSHHDIDSLKRDFERLELAFDLEKVEHQRDKKSLMLLRDSIERLTTRIYALEAAKRLIK